MWTHYANYHKGIVIKIKGDIFNNREGIKFRACNFVKTISPAYPRGFMPVYNVEYSNNLYDPINIVKMRTDEFKKMCLYKYIKWDYEEEKRIFLTKEYSMNNQKITFYEKHLEGIIFGFLSDQQERKRIIDIIMKTYTNCKIYITDPDCEKYKLKIVNYT